VLGDLCVSAVEQTLQKTLTAEAQRTPRGRREEFSPAAARTAAAEIATTTAAQSQSLRHPTARSTTPSVNNEPISKPGEPAAAPPLARRAAAAEQEIKMIAPK